MRRFIDIETGKVVTEAQLAQEFADKVREQPEEYGEITFRQYLSNCMTSHNGTLDEIRVICRFCGYHFTPDETDAIPNSVIEDYDRLNAEKCPCCGKCGATSLADEMEWYAKTRGLVLTKWGKDDYDVFFPDEDYSVRGSLENIMEEIRQYAEG